MEKKKILLYAFGLVLILILILFFLQGNRPRFDSFKYEELERFAELTAVENSSIRDKRKISGSSEINFLGYTEKLEMKRIKSSDDQINLSIPSHWRIEEDSIKALFCIAEDDTESNFKILIHEKEETLGLTLDSYRDYMLNLVAEDTVRDFTIKEFSKAINTMEKIYFLNTSNVIDHKKNETFTIILEIDKYIFDFTYWTTGKRNEFVSKFLFFYIMYTVDVCGYYVLPQPVELRETELIWD